MFSDRSLPDRSRVVLKQWFISEQDSSYLTKLMRPLNESKVDKPKTQRRETSLPTAK